MCFPMNFAKLLEHFFTEKPPVDWFHVRFTIPFRLRLIQIFFHHSTIQHKWYNINQTSFSMNMQLNKAIGIFNPAGNYMFEVNNRNTRTRCEICSKLRHQNDAGWESSIKHQSWIFSGKYFSLKYVLWLHYLNTYLNCLKLISLTSVSKKLFKVNIKDTNNVEWYCPNSHFC